MIERLKENNMIEKPEALNKILDGSMIEPNWEHLFLLLYGFCVAKGLGEEIEKINMFTNVFKPMFFYAEEVSLD